jgi:hypothetical protein
VSTIEEIKHAAGTLSVAEREELLAWLLDVDDEWIGRWLRMQLLGSSIFWSSKRGLPFGKIPSGTGRPHALEVENDPGVLATIRAPA